MGEVQACEECGPLFQLVEAFSIYSLKCGSYLFGRRI